MSYPGELAAMELVVLARQMRIQRSQLQQPRGCKLTTHATSEARLSPPIFVSEECANED